MEDTGNREKFLERNNGASKNEVELKKCLRVLVWLRKQRE